MACGTLLSYDVLCTLDEEVAYVWPSPWSLGKGLYLVNRYLPFVDIIGLIHLVTRHNTADQCRIENGIVTCQLVFLPSLLSLPTGYFFSGVMFFRVLFAEMILMIRTYAIWDRRRSILITFCGLGLFAGIPSIMLTHFAMASVNYVEAPSYMTGCMTDRLKGQFTGASFILLVVTETTTVVLTMIKAAQHLRHSRSTWVSKMYTDGLLFYIYISTLSITNVFLMLFVKSAGWLYPLQSIFHSLFCSRVLMLIFQQHARLHADSSDSLCYSDPTSIHPEAETSLPTHNHYNGHSIVLSNIDDQTSSDIQGRPSFNVVLPTSRSDHNIP